MFHRIPPKQTQAMVLKQLDSLFVIDEEGIAAADGFLDEAIGICESAFSHVKNEYYSKNGESYFDSLHGCQYAMFLYWLSRRIFTRGVCGNLRQTLCPS